MAEEIETTEHVVVKQSNFTKMLDRNRNWSKSNLLEDPLFFKKHLESQRPKYLWIGCSDSRIPAEQITGLRPG